MLSSVLPAAATAAAVAEAAIVTRNKASGGGGGVRANVSQVIPAIQDPHGSSPLLQGAVVAVAATVATAANAAKAATAAKAPSEVAAATGASGETPIVSSGLQQPEPIQKTEHAPSPPYFTLTNLTANIDSGIDNYIEQLTRRNPLKEITVNDKQLTSSIPKFTRIDGDYPKSIVPLYEQMIYHRAMSMNMNPLEIFIPTRYKINFDQINEYFTEMKRRGDTETQELINTVIDAYGNNNNSLFYRHTLPGKVVNASASTTSASSSGIFDLNKETGLRIQFNIDKWHRKYIDWRFYQNATRFFVENKQLPKDELVTLKMEFDEIFDVTKGKGLMKIIDEIGSKHEEINDLYKNYGDIIAENILAPIVSQYIVFFKVMYEDIKKHMPDTLDFIRGRQHDLGYDYRFDESIKSSLFKTYSDIKEIIDSFGDNIENIPYLKLISFFQIFTQKIGQLNQQFPTRLKDAFDSSIAKNGRIGNREYYKTYTLIQYVYWLLSKRGGGVGSDENGEPKNPFYDNYDNLSPVDILSRDMADIRRGSVLYPEPSIISYFDDYLDEKKRLEISHFEEDEADIENAATVVKTVESEKKHVLRLIEIYGKNVSDKMRTFVNTCMAFDNKTLRSYNDIHDKNTVNLPFGIDLLFYVLFFTTNQVVSLIKRNKVVFDKIDDKNGDLQMIRQDIQLKESKLTHIFDLISKLTGIPVERIIPDRVNYYASNTKRNAGLIENYKYHAAWEDRLSVTSGGNGSVGSGDIGKRVNYVTRKMKDGLDKALGIENDAAGTKQEIKRENDKKMKATLITLLEHNTVQVIHMLFAKPRDIWYSPDMRTGSFSSSPKWAFFRLEKPEIVSKGAFKEFHKEWDKEITANLSRLDFVLNKTSTVGAGNIEYDNVFKIKRVDDDTFKSNTKKGFCVFIIASHPSPQLIEPGKDTANDTRFQVSSFSTGAINPTTTDDNLSLGNKLMQKLTQVIKPNAEKCNNVRNLIREQANELSSLTKDMLKAAGVDLSIKITGLKDKIHVSASKRAAKSAMALLVAKDRDVDGAYKIALPYKGYPDCDAVIGYCLYLGGNTVKQDKEEGLRLIFESVKANSKYGEFVIGRISSSSAIDTGSVPPEIQSFMNENQTDAVQYLKKAAENTATEEGLIFAKVELVELKRAGNIDDAILSDDEAVKMIESAADEHYAPAEVILGEMHKDGELGLPVDDKKAAELFENASASGDKAAAFQLGEMYSDGRGVPQDLEKARQLFEIAKEGGRDIILTNKRSLIAAATAALAAITVINAQRLRDAEQPMQVPVSVPVPEPVQVPELSPVSETIHPVETTSESVQEPTVEENDDDMLLQAAAKTTALFLEDEDNPSGEIVSENDIPIDIVHNVEGAGGFNEPDVGSYVSVNDDIETGSDTGTDTDTESEEDEGAGVFGALKQSPSSSSSSSPPPPPSDPTDKQKRADIMKRLMIAQLRAKTRKQLSEQRKAEHEQAIQQRKALRDQFAERRRALREKTAKMGGSEIQEQEQEQVSNNKTRRKSKNHVN